MKDPEIAAMFMRAGSYDASRFGHVISMPKLNGLRAMYIPGRGFYSRDGLLWNDDVLKHIEVSSEVPVDGELYCHGMALQEITSAVGVTRIAPGPRADEVRFYAFDVYKRGTALERTHHLMDNVSTPHKINWRICLTRVELDNAYSEYIAEGYEGQMLKSVYGAYIPQGEKKARTMNLQKRKAFVDDEFECVGVEISQEPRMEGLVGKLIFKRDGGTFGVGTGFTRADRIEWAKNPPIGRRGTVQYLYISKDGVPNNASFLGWRDTL